MSNMLSKKRVICTHSSSDGWFTENKVYSIEYDIENDEIIKIKNNNSEWVRGIPFNGNVWKFALLSYDKKEPVIVEDMQPLIKLLTELNE